MKHARLLVLSFSLIILGCNHDLKSKVPAKIPSEEKKMPSVHKSNDKDKDEIQTLIRQMLKWADAKNEINLLPALIKDSICVGFDFDKQKQNAEKLIKTGFFSDEFIDNYGQIIHTLDKKIKNKELDKWNVYELPSFNFANDASPWCLCQDNLSWDNVNVEVVSLDNRKGELKWNWGMLDSETDTSWKDFSYSFRAVKVNKKWKISYLEGFDYKESIK